MPLTDILIQKINDEGPIPFHDFMETALYHPAEGYYTSAGERIGKAGDYYTSPELTAIFGALLGRQLEEMWNLLDKKTFTIVEYGAGPGTLCHDLLCYFRCNPVLYDQLHYCIIEKSPAMVAKEKELLAEKVCWYDSVNDIPFPVDCILTNEVLDNFPVHRVVMQKELMEVFVDYRNGFAELLEPAGQELQEYFAELKMVLPEGHCTEINTRALEWLKKNAEVLQKGFLITIDYGYSANELYNASAKYGSLLCYKGHAINDSLYTDIGEQDITAHVNFSALHHWGQQYGFACCGFTSQARFLHSLGLIPALNSMEKTNAGSGEKIRQLYQRIMQISHRFNVLIQQKGLHRPRLTGLQFGQPFV